MYKIFVAVNMFSLQSNVQALLNIPMLVPLMPIFLSTFGQPSQNSFWSDLRHGWNSPYH